MKNPAARGAARLRLLSWSRRHRFFASSLFTRIRSIARPFGLFIPAQLAEGHREEAERLGQIVCQPRSLQDGNRGPQVALRGLRGSESEIAFTDDGVRLRGQGGVIPQLPVHCRSRPIQRLPDGRLTTWRCKRPGGNEGPFGARRRHVGSQERRDPIRTSQDLFQPRDLVARTRRCHPENRGVAREKSDSQARRRSGHRVARDETREPVGESRRP